jgi:trimeric autotransporter adhesin
MALFTLQFVRRSFRHLLLALTVSISLTASAQVGPILGVGALCPGMAATLSDATLGGTWSSSNPTVASIGSGSGFINAVSPGTAIISYSAASGTATTVFTVNAVSAISGTTSLCPSGDTTTLSDATLGGTWSSSDATIASIDITSGTVTSVLPGTAIITYVYPPGCVTTTTFTVFPSVAAISGPPTVCIGSAVSLSDASGGGTWSSSNPAIAPVSSSGVVSGSAIGSVVITYTLSTGCYRTTTMTVTPLPAAITGSFFICVGSVVTVSDATTGGSWTISPTTIAAIFGSGSLGTITGMAAGIATITYTLSTGCYTTATETVIPSPTAISGPSAMCGGSTITLSDGTPGGTWSSSNATVATVGSTSGIVYSVAVGTVNITYTISTGSACRAVKTVTVGVTGAGVIYGASSVCTGGSITLTDGVSGGTWSSSNPAIASVGSATGVVSGAAAGTAVISYSVGGGCGSSSATKTVIVSSGGGSITGPATVCSGAAVSLTDPIPGGTWSSSNASVATVSSSAGLVTGVSAGTTIISYSTVCGTAIFTITVAPSPTAIAGLTSVCPGSTTSLTDGTAGGAWTSGNPGVATIGATGLVTGVSPGTAAITYAIAGCMSITTVTVQALCPSSTWGPAGVCTGATVTLSGCTGGGTWSTSTPSVATIDATTGALAGVTPGFATITYTISAGCATTRTETVYMVPAPITGTGSVCVSASITLSDLTAGGIWSSTDPAVNVGSSSGIVTGIAAGTATISYYTGPGCAATRPVTVTPAPAAISGVTLLCPGATATLSDSPGGGVWNSSNAAVAAIGSSTGIVTAAASGTTTITYTASCGVASTTVTVNLSASPGSISGSTAVCSTGGTTTLSDIVTGGSWSSSDPTVASANPATGVVTGVLPGTAIITYSLPCGITTTTVSVLPIPSAITGTTSICISSASTLSSAVSGGTWSSSDPAVAPIGSATGIVTGLAIGTAAITYTMPSGCYATTSVTVHSLTTPIMGIFYICIGSVTTLTNASAGGTWTVSPSAGPVTIFGSGSTGTITGMAAGTSTITYTLASGCYAIATETVITAPSAVTGSTSVCMGGTTVLSDATTGGTWSSSNISVATVGTVTGVVSAVSAGTATITYAIASGSGCRVTSPVTVWPVPAAISGATSVCVGSSTTLTDATGGGTWASSSSGIASVTAGIVTGISAGIATISYILGSGCSATVTATVHSLPAASASATVSSCGSHYTLTAGGGISYSWSPSTGLSCTVCSTTSVTPTLPTSYTVTATDINGCSDTASVPVDGNRISGYISSGGSSAPFLVWLIQFNPSDSSIAATDSVMTCPDGGVPYYEFTDKVAGNYLIKAKLPGGVPGTSGYIPTYSFSTPYWYLANVAAHSGGTDTLNINMVYGTVPAGPGFISGYVYAGAGRGTSGDAPAAGLLMLLKDAATGSILTYTYSDTTGAYIFSGLANGDYVVYPEVYNFKSTPSPTITLTSASETILNRNFKEYLTSKIIKPLPDTTTSVLTNPQFSLYPNPTASTLVVQWTNQPTGKAELKINDVVGRNVYTAAINLNTTSGKTQLDLATLKSGVYLISINCATIKFTSKLVIER